MAQFRSERGRENPERRPAVDQGNLARRGGLRCSTPRAVAGRPEAPGSPTPRRQRCVGRGARGRGRRSIGQGRGRAGPEEEERKRLGAGQHGGQGIRPRPRRTELRPAANSKASRSNPPVSGVNRLSRSRDGSDISPPTASGEPHPGGVTPECSAGRTTGHRRDLFVA